MQEKDLLHRIRSGDREAFRILYDRHAPAVYRLCLRFTGNEKEAEDLCQDVFIKVYTSIRTFNARSRLATWIHRITVNHTLNYLRKTKQSRFLLPLDGDVPAAHLDTSGIPGAEPHLPPDQLLEKKERAAILRKAVNELPENQRLVLILQKYDGFSSREISEMLDCTLLSVQSRLHRAKKNLAALLQEYSNHL